MTTDRSDPAFDDRVYCSRCLGEIDPGQLPDDPDEVVGCHRCHTPLLVCISPGQMRTEKAIRRADWDAAREDGLIR